MKPGIQEWGTEFGNVGKVQESVQENCGECFQF